MFQLIVSAKESSGFDASAYWQERVGAGADITVVGHRAMGHAYNGEIYARRIEALESMLQRHVGKPPEALRVLDIGCGSGIYTGFWQARGVRDYTGLDISAGTIDHLGEAYPGYRFVHADVSEALPDAIDDGKSFDVITVFDVLYHIVDDQMFRSAIANLGGLIAGEGKLFIMDSLCHKDYQFSDHVIYRARERYLAEFRENQLSLADSEQLFHFLVPPITGVRIFDLFSSGAFNLFGRAIQLNDRLAAWAAAKLRRLDSRLRERDVSVQNGELLAFARSSAIDG
jgi:SAM-dependent methyltransferase